ncbi:hypothetical protein HYI43_06585 [Staphylococcus taiwanensis]|nr:hypothetical protein HYI43_06585 [Staphylococcus taiwanensis]
MLCCVNKDVKQAVENINTIKPLTLFTIIDLLGSEYFNALEKTEQEFIHSRFHDVVIRGEVMNVSIESLDKNQFQQYKRLY